MAVVDSYPETNQNSTFTIAATGGNDIVGQTFKGNGMLLTSAKFYLDKIGTPSGPAVAALYATTGTYGTSACVPTGSALATSNSIDVSTFTTSPTLTLYEFIFPRGALLASGTPYAIVLDVSGSTSTGANRMTAGQTTSGGHSGNRVNFDNSIVFAWAGSGTIDLDFYVFGKPLSGGLLLFQ